MEHFWERGPMMVRELRELYAEPRPHVNTLSTLVRILETKGFLAHKAYGNTYQYYPAVTKDEYSRKSLNGVISNYFNNSYLNAVSALVCEEKISLEELKQLVEELERSKGETVK